MSEAKYLADSSKAVVIDPGTTLGNGISAEGNYDNSAELDLEGVLYLTVQFTAGPPANGTKIADVWNLPGDGEASESFPVGSTSVTPQRAFHVGGIECQDASTSATRIYALHVRKLWPHTNKFVLKNTSGEQYTSTWDLQLTPYKRQVT